jgi:hypothetical protein
MSDIPKERHSLTNTIHLLVLGREMTSL